MQTILYCSYYVPPIRECLGWSGWTKTRWFQRQESAQFARDHPAPVFDLGRKSSGRVAGETSSPSHRQKRAANKKDIIVCMQMRNEPSTSNCRFFIAKQFPWFLWFSCRHKSIRGGAGSDHSIIIPEIEPGNGDCSACAHHVHQLDYRKKKNLYHSTSLTITYSTSIGITYN